MPGVLELLQGLNPDQWRVTLGRTGSGCRVWRLFHRGESTPRLILREP
jgi:hypothetical protein